MKAGVAQDHRLQHLLIIVLELVLLQDRHPQVLGNGDLPGGRLQLPGEDLEEGGLPRPVGADDAVAVARGKLEAGPCKKLLPPKGEADVRNCYQFFVLHYPIAFQFVHNTINPGRGQVFSASLRPLL